MEGKLHNTGLDTRAPPERLAVWWDALAAGAPLPVEDNPSVSYMKRNVARIMRALGAPVTSLIKMHYLIKDSQHAVSSLLRSSLGGIGLYFVFAGPRVRWDAPHQGYQRQGFG